MNISLGKVKFNLSNISFNTKKKFVIFSASIFVFVIISLLYFFYLNKHIEHLFILKSEVSALEKQLEQKHTNFNMYDENQVKIKQLDDAFSNSKNKAIEDFKLPEALITVGNLMENNSIKEKSFTIGDKITFQDFYKVPIELDAIGKFQNVSSFIKSMNNQKFFYKLTMLKISSKDVIEKDFVNLTARYELFIIELNNTAVETLKPIKELYKNPFYYEEGMNDE